MEVPSILATNDSVSLHRLQVLMPGTNRSMMMPHATEDGSFEAQTTPRPHWEPERAVSNVRFLFQRNLGHFIQPKYNSYRLDQGRSWTAACRRSNRCQPIKSLPGKRPALLFQRYVSMFN